MSEFENATPVFLGGLAAEFDCTVRHLMETYRVPRFVAGGLAGQLLALSQPTWHPLCNHTPRHLFAEALG